MLRLSGALTMTLGLMVPALGFAQNQTDEPIIIESLHPTAGSELEPRTELGQVMSEIGDLFQLVRDAAATPAQDSIERNSRLADASRSMATLFTRSRLLTPTSAVTPVDIADYQARIDSLIDACGRLEAAYRENRPRDAAVIARQMGEQASSGHRKFRQRT